MNFKQLRYKISTYRRGIFNAGNNFKIIDSGKNLHIDPEFEVINSKLEGFNYLFGKGKLENSTLGLFTYVQNGANIGRSTIGRFCSIGPNVMIAQGEHPVDFLSTHPIFYENSYVEGFPSLVSRPIFGSHKDVHIGSDVWIGANCYIRDGVSIGSGSIIGTGSIVTRDIPPYSVAVGVPAKVIKMRFDEEIIQELLELKWWDWEIEKIIRNKEFFQRKFSIGDLKNIPG